MSGIGEALAIIGAAAALVTACKDGGTIAKQIAKRRKNKGVAPPTELLEQSLDKGQIEITAKIEEGSKRFGVGFKNGDIVAVQALKDVTIEMQASLIRHLVVALEDESQTDTNFLVCESSVTIARMRAINILNNLYERQTIEATNNALGSPNGRQSQDPALEMPSIPNAPANDVNDASSLSPERTSAAEAPIPKPGRLRFLKRNSRQNTNMSVASYQSSSSQLSRRTLSSPAPPPIAKVQTSPELPIPAEPRALESRRNTFSTTMEARSAQDQSIYPKTPRRSTAISMSSSHSDSLKIFCEGAHYVQASLDNRLFKLGFKLCTSTSRKRGVSYYWACQGKKCRVEGMARQDEEGQWQYDDKVRWSPHGIGHRWLFLAKSHVKSTSDDWKRHSKCLICARGLGIESRTYISDDALFDHIAKFHCGKICAGLPLRGPVCFDHNSLFAGTKESFDICFPDACPQHPLDDTPAPSSPALTGLTAFTLDQGPSEEAEEAEETPQYQLEEADPLTHNPW